MESEISPPRSLVAYDVARRLIYHSVTSHPKLSPVATAQTRLDEMLEAGLIPASEHRQLSELLLTVEGCDFEQCSQVDDLVREVTLDLTNLLEQFPEHVLVRLRDLV